MNKEVLETGLALVQTVAGNKNVQKAVLGSYGNGKTRSIFDALSNEYLSPKERSKYKKLLEKNKAKRLSVQLESDALYRTGLDPKKAEKLLKKLEKLEKESGKKKGKKKDKKKDKKKASKKNFKKTKKKASKKAKKNIDSYGVFDISQY